MTLLQQVSGGQARRWCRRAAPSVLLAQATFAALLSACTPSVARYAARAASADSLARLSIQNEQSVNAASIPENTVSVAPLRVLSADTTFSALGYGMSALLMADLGVTSRLTLVERARLDAVIRELELAQTDRVDTLTAPRIGRLVGARRIVVGTIDLREGENLRIDSYVTNATTGAIGSSVSGNARLAQIFDAEKALAFRLFDALGVTLTPAERRMVERRPTQSLRAFLAYSQGVRAEAGRDFAGAAASYTRALRFDPNFAAASDRLATLQGSPESMGGGAFSPISRAVTISNDLVNRSAPLTVGTGVDVPVVSRTQIITFSIIVRTP